MTPFLSLLTDITTEHFGFGHHLKFGLFWICRLCKNVWYFSKRVLLTYYLTISGVISSPQWGHFISSILRFIISYLRYSAMQLRQRSCVFYLIVTISSFPRKLA
jgi:hypothetical protein